jgi:hypothetical protein
MTSAISGVARLPQSGGDSAADVQRHFRSRRPEKKGGRPPHFFGSLPAAPRHASMIVVPASARAMSF